MGQVSWNRHRKVFIMGVEGGSGGGSGGGGVGGISLSAPSFGAAPCGPGGISGFAEYGNLGEFQSKGSSALGPEIQVLSGPTFSDVSADSSFLKNSVSLYTRQTNPIAQAVVAEAESIIVLAQNPLKESNSVVEIKQPEYELPSWQLTIPQTEPRFVPIAVPNIEEYPQFQRIVSPSLEPVTQTQNTIAVQTATEPQEEIKQSVVTQPVLKEVEKEEVFTEKVVNKQSVMFEKEQEEELNLKDVVDEEVLSTRVKEFGTYIEKAGLDVKTEAWKKGKHKGEKEIEIDGERIVSFVSPESADKRCGLVKKTGPDGSREEVIEEITPKRFSSMQEAKNYVIATIIRKVPVKKAKEGREVGRKDVARVLRYLLRLGVDIR